MKPTDPESATDHGFAPSCLPLWIQERWELLMVGVAVGLGALLGYNIAVRECAHGRH